MTKDENEKKHAADSRTEAPAEKSESELKIETLEAELKELGDKYLRTLAEYDNYRKRMQKERESWYADMYCDAVSRFLPVVDNLERSLAQIDEQSEHRKGIEMIVRQCAELFEKMGVRRCGAVGDAFDPMLHEAVQHVEDEAYGENEVCEVLLGGYVMGERVIRHAVVKVAN